MFSLNNKPFFDKSLDKLFRFFFSDVENGLSYPIFRLAAYLVPMVNIELAIINETEEILLTFRKSSTDIPISGWHLPGGIIRVGETLEERVEKTAELELGLSIYEQKIVAMTETLIPKKISRRHFISFLVVCKLKVSNSDALINEGIKNFDWFKLDQLPVDLIPNHERYRPFFDKYSSMKDSEIDSIVIIKQDKAFNYSFEKL